MAIFDEANAVLTEQLTGRTIDYVVRNGKVLELYTTDGHVVKLQADVDYDIHHNGTDVKVMLEGVSMFGIAGTTR